MRAAGAEIVPVRLAVAPIIEGDARARRVSGAFRLGIAVAWDADRLRAVRPGPSPISEQGNALPEVAGSWDLQRYQ
jgi:hypothetical protein